MKAFRVNKQHEKEIVSILNQAISERYNAYTNQFERAQGHKWFLKLFNTAIEFWGIEEDGQILGWGSLTPYRSGREALSQCAEITIYVHKDFRRKGVAVEILCDLINSAIQNHVHFLIAVLLDNNFASRTFFQKHGFKEWGHFPDIVHFENQVCGHLYLGKPI